jgi:hypothetical protein
MRLLVRFEGLRFSESLVSDGMAGLNFLMVDTSGTECF